MEILPQRPSQERALFPYERRGAREALAEILVLEGKDELLTGSYLTMRRLTLQNRYESGNLSDRYECDVVSRPGNDAVAVVPYTVGSNRLIHVVFRESIRPPVYFRKSLELSVADDRVYHTLPEIVTGVLEPGEQGIPGIKARASRQLKSEAGFTVSPDDVILLGGGTFPAPGTYTEKVYLTAAYVDPAEKEPVTPEEPMGEAARVVFYELGAALRMCQDGRIPDAKAELGVRRLADYLGFIPQLGLYSHELPVELRDRYDPLGM